MRIAILGSGFIARFYATSLHAQRRKDYILTVYSRDIENAKRFADDYQLAHFTNDIDEAINHPDVDVVLISLPNDLHEMAVAKCADAKKHVLCTKPLGRTAAEAKRMLDMVEKAGIFGGYLEDLCYTPKFLKSVSAIQQGSIGRILWTKSREAHPGPHSDWFWNKDKSGGGAIIDLGCHCIEIGRNFIGKQVKPIEVMCWADTQVHPIEAEDHAIGLVKYANGAMSQFEVSWTFRGGMDLRDEVMGTEGSIWLNNFLRTGFEIFSTGKGDNYVAEKAEISKGWLFPVGDEAHELGYPNMFTDMFTAIEEGRDALETFYDGYVVNAIIDAAYLSAKTKKWEPVILEDWRGEEIVDKKQELVSFDENYFLIKEELMPNEDLKRILKHKATGEVIQKIFKIEQFK
ncbi:gfo/Idh/MocA family oxidoreductase [Flavobacterium circumlabens]|uniref:Dehydrogenase n=1 Tax=Flavobacterium circumlabens TaxID=2133765 RepID=A0A4Y7UEJ4_9FLAO|nr:Gfo/Idh/MocA family oxidoreductase [Flavobacterium circumlabens]TCN59559.1 putative dehydrogenase [Flavobacterium circumlabens]TEB44847.1 gfo/Idh/MocA family oxidoreductase [Flavobacterium circumlabens]